MSSTFKLLVIGVVAGFGSGLFGIGGGIVMVPLLVFVVRLDQHHAHATSLAAAVVLGAAGALTYTTAGAVDLAAGLLLAGGGIVGAPLGARLMAQTPEASLKVAFGALLIGLSISLLVT